MGAPPPMRRTATGPRYDGAHSRRMAPRVSVLDAWTAVGGRARFGVAAGDTRRSEARAGSSLDEPCDRPSR
eukprot:2146442-Prymnesium_polylepis.1